LAEKTLVTQATELWQLVVAYFKQETLDPIKSLGRFLAFGILGSVLLCLGLPLLVLGLLRFLQNETKDHLTGSLTWVPYAATLGLSVIFAGLAARAISAKKRRTS
jgi:uncharacterized membrane protein YidH (DUF202 family)